MTGEISIGGIFMPTLLLLAAVALVVTILLVRLLSAFGLYRYVAYRALVDLALYVLILGGLAFLLSLTGIQL